MKAVKSSETLYLYTNAHDVKSQKAANLKNTYVITLNIMLNRVNELVLKTAVKPPKKRGALI
jgi:hypothetical protein